MCDSMARIYVLFILGISLYCIVYPGKSGVIIKTNRMDAKNGNIGWGDGIGFVFSYRVNYC